MTPPSQNSQEFSAADELMALIAKAFDTTDIPYAVIGGQAVIQHGYARTTTDVDCTLSVDLTRHIDVVSMLLGHGFSPRYPQDDNMIRERQIFVADHTGLGLEADFSFANSPYLDLSLSRSVEHLIEGYPVRFLGLEDLIIQKMIAGRPQDYADIAELLLVNPDTDTHEVKRWLTEFEQLVETPLVALFDQFLKQAEP